jgi:hypothetical protein
MPFRLGLRPSRTYIMSSAELVRHNPSHGVRLWSTEESVKFYEADDSGMLPNPVTSCKTKPEILIFYITHNVIVLPTPSQLRCPQTPCLSPSATPLRRNPPPPCCHNGNHRRHRRHSNPFLHKGFLLEFQARRCTHVRELSFGTE